MKSKRKQREYLKKVKNNFPSSVKPEKQIKKERRQEKVEELEQKAFRVALDIHDCETLLSNPKLNIDARAKINAERKKLRTLYSNIKTQIRGLKS